MKILVVPVKFQSEILSLCHDIPSAGHQGVDRTKERLKSSYAWYCMAKDAKNYVSTCSTCSRCKKSTRRARYAMTRYHAGSPMERVHLDFLGRLPRTPSGNEYILMMVDQFTKWVECIPLPSQTAEITAHAAVNEFFTRFGCPFELFSDQGRNFESELFSQICKILNIHKTRTTSYRPSANGQVERYNRTLMDAVRCYVGKTQNQWDRFLAQIAGALRSSVNRQTGYTPNKLMLGREINIPANLVFANSAAVSETKDMAQYVQDLEQAITSAHELARDKLQTSQETMKRNYDLQVLVKTYKVGDLVYLLDSATMKGKCKKLQQQWKGPGIILNKITPYLFRVKFPVAIMTANHDRLKVCKDREVPQWILRFRRNLAVHEKDIPQVSQSETLYCTCRKQYCGEFMIQCDECAEWFHGDCVNITPRKAMGIKKYRCPTCKINASRLGDV